jgi:hypothetical protein
MATWTDARAKVRRDLWREDGDGTAGVGIPDATLDEAIHQACCDLEGEKRWCYLEQIQETAGFINTNRLAMPIISRGVNWLAATKAGQVRRYLTLAPLDRVMELQEINKVNAWPQFYAVSGTEIFLDCTMDGATKLEASHTFQTPDEIEEAVERGDTNVTIQLQYQLICARAAAIIALTYLKDADEAQRQEAAYSRMYDALLDRDDEMRESMTKPEIEPDVGVAPYNWEDC